METRYTIDVSALDAAHRRAIEEVIGVPLHANHRLTIDVTELPDRPSDELHRRGTTLEEWTSVYDGLTEEQIEEIDRIINMRARSNRTM